MRLPYLQATPDYSRHSSFTKWENGIFPHSDVLPLPGNQSNQTPDATNPVLERGSDSQRTQYHHDDDLHDPQYESFLRHLKEDGKSYKLKMLNHCNGNVILVKYEEEDVLPKFCQQNTLNASSMNGTDHTNKGEAFDGVCGRKSSPAAAFNPESHRVTKSSDADNCYRKFIEKLRFENGFMVLKWKPGIAITYEVDDALTTCERMDTESTINKQKLPDPPIKVIEDDGTDFVPHGFPTSIQYKRELMQVLQKPYDHHEYEELLKKATERKPILKEKHLRNVSISYYSDQMGLSYLDRHPDLAHQIDAAEPRRGLALLRGFFFWLQHLCHEGTFMPWKSFASSAAPLLTRDCEIIPSTDANFLGWNNAMTPKKTQSKMRERTMVGS